MQNAATTEKILSRSILGRALGAIWESLSIWSPSGRPSPAMEEPRPPMEELSGTKCAPARVPIYTVPALAKGVTQKAQNIKGAKVKLGEGAQIRRKRKSYLNR